MNLFGKKKDEEFDDEESLIQEEELENKKLKRQLKDLHAENKKKRKEPPKPWGKPERLIVGGFFLFTTLGAALMFLFSHDYKLPGLPRISLKPINFTNPFGEEVIQIGQKSTSQNDAKADGVITFFKQETAPLSGHYGFFVIRLDSGMSYGVSSTEQFQAASLIKLPLMVLMHKMSEEGKIDLEAKYSLKESDKVQGSGVMYSKSAGTIYTYRELVRLMGTNSDNTAYRAMKNIIGSTEIKNYLSEIGIVRTSIDTGLTTPEDMGRLFQKIWSGSLINEENKNSLLGYLTNTVYEDWITAGVPSEVRVAHKFGQDSGVVADAGIVINEKPYVLVIMGQGITSQDALKLFPKISKYIYEAEAK